MDARTRSIPAGRTTAPSRLSKNASNHLPDTTELIIQGHKPIQSSDLFADAFGSQQVAYAAMRSDDAQSYAAAREVEVQLMQHARAGEIDMR